MNISFFNTGKYDFLQVKQSFKPSTISLYTLKEIRILQGSFSFNVYDFRASLPRSSDPAPKSLRISKCSWFLFSMCSIIIVSF